MRIEIDPRAPTPPSEQIADQVRFAVAAGHLATGDRLPSVRKLAGSATVNPNTVARAYRELEREGTVETRPGSGVYVAPHATELCRDLRDELVAERLGREIRSAVASGLSPDRVRALVERQLDRARVTLAAGTEQEEDRP